MEGGGDGEVEEGGGGGGDVDGSGGVRLDEERHFRLFPIQ